LHPGGRRSQPGRAGALTGPGTRASWSLRQHLPHMLPDDLRHLLARLFGGREYVGLRGHVPCAELVGQGLVLLLVTGAHVEVHALTAHPDGVPKTARVHADTLLHLRLGVTGHLGQTGLGRLDDLGAEFLELAQELVQALHLVGHESPPMTSSAWTYVQSMRR